MRQPLVFQRGAGLRRRVARALVLLVGGGLVAWVGLVATAVVPNGGTVELPDFVGPLQRAVAPATSAPAPGPGTSAPPATTSRPVLVIPPLPFLPTPSPTAPAGSHSPTPGGGPNATLPGHTPERLTGQGHEVAFAGYADADATRLPEPVWIANESLGRRILERASERDVRLYLPGRLLGGELDATALETARRAETAGLLPLLPAPAPARRDDLDGLIVVRRTADLDALRSALARARTSGVTLVAASALAGIGSEPLPLGARIAGGAAFAAFDLWRSLADLVVALAGAATLLMLLRLVVVAILATAQARRPDVAGGDGPTVAAPAAAYNGEVVIETGVRAILASDVTRLQVVVVDDGSTRATAARASEAADGDERLRVVRQPNGGKASALNTALARTDAAVVVAMDADSLLEREALRRPVAPFSDQAIGAVAGDVKVGERSRRLGALPP